MIKAILFDCDGTLVDSESQTGQSIQMVLERHGFQGLKVPVSWTRGQAWEAIAKRILATYPQLPKTPDYAQEFITSWESLVAQAPAIPGAVKALREAHRWFSIALVTSSHNRSVEPMLQHHGIAGYFKREARVCAEDVVNSKPHPEAYLTAAAKLGVEPHECLVFEDSIAGIRSAKAAGMQCIAILETTHNPDECRATADHSIQNFNTLPSTFWSSMAQPTVVHATQSSLIQACL